MFWAGTPSTASKWPPMYSFEPSGVAAIVRTYGASVACVTIGWNEDTPWPVVTSIAPRLLTLILGPGVPLGVDRTWVKAFPPRYMMLPTWVCAYSVPVVIHIGSMEFWIAAAGTAVAARSTPTATADTTRRRITGSSLLVCDGDPARNRGPSRCGNVPPSLSPS